MKKFIIYLFLYCCAPLPLLYLLNYIVDSGLHKSRYILFSDWNDILAGKINADVLIMGSSRARLNFSPKIIDSVLTTNSYNIGVDAAYFDFQFKKLKIYLQHNKKPKYIVMEVGFMTTLDESTELPGVQQLLPYLKDSGVWHLIKSKHNNLSICDRYFPLFKYNDEAAIVKEGVFSFFGKGVKDVRYKGYEGKTFPWDSTFFEFKKKHPNGWTPDTAIGAVVEFNDYLEFCKANDIKVIMVYPPTFYQATSMLNPKRKEEILSMYAGFSKKFNIPFYSYENDSLSFRQQYFYNSQHLNKRGSEIFSLEFASDIKKYIQQQ